MEYLFYGFCGTVGYYLFSLYKSFISLKDKVKYLENRIEKQREILEKEISIIYDKLEK